MLVDVSRMVAPRAAEAPVQTLAIRVPPGAPALIALAGASILVATIVVAVMTGVRTIGPVVNPAQRSLTM